MKDTIIRTQSGRSPLPDTSGQGFYSKAKDTLFLSENKEEEKRYEHGPKK